MFAMREPKGTQTQIVSSIIMCQTQSKHSEISSETRCASSWLSSAADRECGTRASRPPVRQSWLNPQWPSLNSPLCRRNDGNRSEITLSNIFEMAGVRKIGRWSFAPESSRHLRVGQIQICFHKIVKAEIKTGEGANSRSQILGLMGGILPRPIGF